MKQIFMVSFRGILGTGQIEDRNMMKGKCTDGKKIMSKFMSKLVKMIRDAGSKFNDYSSSPKIRQILLQENQTDNMQEILQKAKEIVLFKKQRSYKRKSRERYKNLSQEEKHKIKESQRKMYQELVQYKKEALQNK